MGYSVRDLETQIVAMEHRIKGSGDKTVYLKAMNRSTKESEEHTIQLKAELRDLKDFLASAKYRDSTDYFELEDQ